MSRTTLLLSRHPGAQAWLRAEAARRGWADVRDAAHLAPAMLPDAARWRVAGVLPIGLAAGLVAAGVECWSLDLDLTTADRGTELDAHSMRLRRARLRRIVQLSLAEN